MGDVREEGENDLFWYDFNKAWNTEDYDGMAALVERELSARAAVPEGWVVDRNEDGEVRVCGPSGSPGGMHPRADSGPLAERLLHALATALIDAAAPQTVGEDARMSHEREWTVVSCPGCDRTIRYVKKDASVLPLPAMFQAPPEPAPSAHADVETLAKAVLDARSHIGPCRPDDPDDAQQWDRLTEAAHHLSGAQQAEACIVGWLHEDVLPEGYPYDAMFPHSRVDFVRMFPVYAPAAAQQAAKDGAA